MATDSEMEVITASMATHVKKFILISSPASGKISMAVV
jgi:hypothetical protein